MKRGDRIMVHYEAVLAEDIKEEFSNVKIQVIDKYGVAETFWVPATALELIHE